MQSIYKFRIKTKLLTISIIIAIAFILVGLLSFYYINQIYYFNELTKKVYSLKFHIIKIKSIEKDFSYVDNFKSSFFEEGNNYLTNSLEYEIDKNNLLIREIEENHIIVKYKLIEKLNKLKSNLNVFNNNTNMLIEKAREIGNEKYGLKSKLFKTERILYNLIIEHDDKKELLEWFSKLIDLQKTFSTINKVDYFNQFLSNVNTIKKKYENKIDNNSNLDYKTIKLLGGIEDYKISFDNLVAKQTQIGLNVNEGIKGKITVSTIQIENLVEEIVIEVEEKNNRRVKSSITTLIIFILVISLILILVIHTISLSITKPILLIKNYISELVKGKIPKPVKLKNEDEVWEMSNKLNSYVDKVKEKAKFADEIGKGYLSSKFSPSSEEDILGNSLLIMQKSLQKAKLKEKERRRNEQITSWQNIGSNNLAEILRHYEKKVSKISSEITVFLVDYIKAAQGAFFITNNKENSSKQRLKLISTYAYSKIRHRKKVVFFGEGIIGTCAIEKKIIYLTNIPESYIKITSGFGEAKPKSLLVVPLVYNNITLGVIEIASFKKIENYKIKFIENIAHEIASTISYLTSKEDTEKLLNKTQIQAEELIQQEEEIRQNLEELRASQDESKRRETEIHNTLQSINEAVLLFEFNLNGKITDVNRRVTELFSMPFNVIIGQYIHNLKELSNDDIKIHKTNWDKIKNGEIIRIIEKIVIKSNIHWLLSIYIPVFSETHNLVKIINIASDISLSIKKEHGLNDEIEDLYIQEEMLKSKIKLLEQTNYELELSVTNLNIQREKEFQDFNKLKNKKMTIVNEYEQKISDLENEIYILKNRGHS